MFFETKSGNISISNQNRNTILLVPGCFETKSGNISISNIRINFRRDYLFALKYSKAEADQKIEDGKTTMLVGHLAESNPHNITKADVGLGNVDNLSKESLFSDPAFSGALNGAISGISKASISLRNVTNVDVQ